MADVNRVRGVCRRALADAGAGRQSAHRSLWQLRVGAKGARRRAVDHRTLLAPPACRPCEAAGRLGAHSVCQCPMGTGRRPRPSRFPNCRAIRQHPRSQPAHSSVERRARCPPRELSLSARMHWRTQRKAAPIRRDTRGALSVPAERHGRTARYGRASGTASGAIGRRLPGQPVAVAQSSWLRRAQQFERASDSRAAWGRPGDGHCLPVCTRHRARRRPPSAAAAA